MSNTQEHNQFEQYIFLGIGGIGMSALARYLVIQGKTVLGYDRSATQITTDLTQLGVEITHQDHPVTGWFDPSLKSSTVIVWTPAVAQSDPWMIAARDSEFPMIKRAQLLGQVSAESGTVLAIAGTHGKTTTSAILSHLLAEAGKSSIGFLGGIAQNYETNLIVSPTTESALRARKAPDFCVVEADEFDRSFLWIKPDYACITSVDPDHLDVYTNRESFEMVFDEFVEQLQPKNLLIAEDLKFDGVRVGRSDLAQIKVEGVEIIDGAYRFNVKFPDCQWDDLMGPLPGEHNLQNVLMAIGLARQCGLTRKEVLSGLSNFKGIHRRFNQYELTRDRVLIDDYAHHPTELKALLQGVNEFYPNRSHTLVFQPHLYSRTRDFARDFAQVLNQFDEVLLVPIYPAREEPIHGIDSRWLADICDKSTVKFMSISQVLTTFKESDSSIFIVAGAGDIGLQVNRLTQILNT